MFIAIIQARTGSTRFPEKVLKEFEGTPSIMHTVNRTNESNFIENIIVATSDNKNESKLINLLKQNNIFYFQGSENDVLSRYYHCFTSLDYKEKVKGIVRITGDCPLIQPLIIDDIISTFLDKKLDYCCTDESFADGLDVEVLSPQTLKTINEKAKLASQREHVTLYIHDNLNEFKHRIISNKTDDRNIRITLDEEKDYHVLKLIFENLPSNERTIENIKTFLKNNPEVSWINSNITRNEGLIKSIKDEEK